MTRTLRLAADRALTTCPTCRRYDDVNEFFWSRENLDALLMLSNTRRSDKQSLGVDFTTVAYETLRSRLTAGAEGAGGHADASRDVQVLLSRHFRKTFHEVVSAGRVIYALHRVLLLHQTLGSPKVI